METLIYIFSAFGVASFFSTGVVIFTVLEAKLDAEREARFWKNRNPEYTENISKTT